MTKSATAWTVWSVYKDLKVPSVHRWAPGWRGRGRKWPGGVMDGPGLAEAGDVRTLVRVQWISWPERRK